jgi:hypothetical protein
MGYIKYAGFGIMKVGHETQTVGPRHDPYQNEVWYAIVDRDGHVYEAIWKEASLGDDVLELVVDDKVVRREEFPFAGINEIFEERLMQLKWSLLFKRHVGKSIDECKGAFFENWEPDPMGEPSMYI